ncbi:MAG: flippase [Patescibacteria group bacterium]
MSTTRKIAHNTIAQIIGKIISTFLGLLALGMMTRYLPTEQFGWYVTTIAFLQFVGILIDFGLIPVTAQMLSEPEHDKTELLNNLFTFRLVTAIFFLAFAPIIALFFPYPATVKIAIAFSTISFLAVALNQILTGYLQTAFKMHVYAVGEIIGRIVLIVGLLILIRFGSTFLPIMGMLVLATVAHTAYLFFSIRQTTPITLAYNRNLWQGILRKMWPISIAIIFNVVYLKGDIILLSLYRAQTDVALYGAAYRVLDIVTQLAMMMMGVMLPLLTFAWSRGLKEDFKRYYQQAFDALMVFAVPMMVGTYILSEKIIVLVAGPKYLGAGIALQLLSIAVFGVFLGAVFGHSAVALNRQKQTIWIYASDAILTLCGYLYFIPRFGMVGAAGMTIFSELYAGVLLFLTIRHYSQTPLQFKTFGKIILSSVAMGMTITSLPTLPVLPVIFLGMITYGAVLLIIKGISVTTLKEIFSIKSA